MTIRILIADRLKVQVDGTIKDADGADEPFSFTLDCKRLDADALRAILAPEAAQQSLTVLLGGLVSGWSGVSDDDGRPVPFGAEAFQSLLKIPGLASLIWAAYINQVMVKEKN